MEEPGCLPESSGMSRAWCVQMPRQRAGHWWAGEEGPASLLPGPWDGGAEVGGNQEQLAVCSKLASRLTSQVAQLVVLSNLPSYHVCRFHFAAGLGKQGSASVPGPAREQSSGAGERRAEARAGGRAGRRCCMRRPGVSKREKEEAGRVCVCMHTLVSASISVLCVHLCRCICVSVCAYVCSVRLGICVCVGGWVRWAGNGYSG